jgi:cytochrome P450
MLMLHRRYFSHAFSEKSLREQEPIIQSYIELLVEKLHENVGKNNNIANWYKFTTFDVIGDLVFGESFDCLKSATLHVCSPNYISSLQVRKRGARADTR